MWTLFEAVDLVKKLEMPARKSGVLVAMNGSVLKNGAGNDLDLIVYPWRIGYDFEGFTSFLESIGWRKLAIHNTSILDRIAIGFDVEGKTVEMQLYNVRERVGAYGLTR